MFLTRVVSAIVFGLIILLSIYAGGFIFALLCVILACAATLEYVRMLGEKGYSQFRPISATGCAAITVCIGLSYFALLPPLLALLFGVLIFAAVGRQKTPDSAMLPLGGILYLGVGFGCLLALRGFDAGYLALGAFLIAWSTDVGAYGFGSLFGKNKLLPALSPHKTREGAIGGLLACIAVFYTYNHFCLGQPPLFALVVGMLGSILAQLGDLAESFIKRWTGVKDSGRAIPGHGGILDRFDSMMMITPMLFAAYYLFGDLIP